MTDIIPCMEAKQRGLVRYYTGTPCIRGHFAHRYVQSGKCIACHKELRRSNGRDPVEYQKHLARKRVENAIRRGSMIPQPCELCGSTAKIHAHHEDYSRAFDVVWLCEQHHVERHNMLKAGAA